MSAQPVTLDMSTAQPLSAPVTLDMSTAQLLAPPESAGKRLGTNFLSGLGVTSNEQAKNFFVHPLDTVIKSFEAQGELAQKAREAYDKGDYMGALQHGLNYLVPFVGQQTDQAGEQLKQGDIAGGIGRTLGAAVPIAAGSPEVQGAAGDAAGAAASLGARGVRAAARGVNAGLEKAPGTIGGSIGIGVGNAVGGHVGAEIGGVAGAMAGRELLPRLRIPGEGVGLPNRVTGGPVNAPPYIPTPEAPAIYPGANLPETPSVDLLRARSLMTKPQAVTDPAVGLAQPVPKPPTPAPAVSAEPSAPTPSGAGMPRTLSGESALRQVLTGQDNASLLKIAKSRGLNVTKESQLKAGVADNLLINKIIDDFSDDELSEMRDRYLENNRFKHNFGDIGPEALRVKSLQSYFPDVKIPAAALKRTEAATTAPAGNLESILQESLKRVPQKSGSPAF